MNLKPSKNLNKVSFIYKAKLFFQRGKNQYFFGAMIFPILMLAWGGCVVKKYPFLFLAIEALSLEFGIIGAMFFFNSKKIIGLIGVLICFLLYIFIRFYYNINIMRELLFWVYVMLIFVFVYDLIKGFIVNKIK